MDTPVARVKVQPTDYITLRNVKGIMLTVGYFNVSHMIKKILFAFIFPISAVRYTRAREHCKSLTLIYNIFKAENNSVPIRRVLYLQ